jgi:hypothetical protein
LDPYNGPPEVAELYDVVLNLAVERHQDGVERTPHAPAALIRDVKVSDWANPEVQEQLRKQIHESFGGGSTGLDASAYVMVDQFKEDAMSCWTVKHNRIPACPDYKAPHMRLVPDTAAERREVGMAKASEYDRNNPALTKYLCDYCPVKSLVQEAAMRKAGMYK